MFKSYQEAFDAVITHMENQGRRAVNHNNQCVYLSPDGLKCAVGAFIPHGHPAQEFAGTFYSLINAYPDLIPIFNIDERFKVFWLTMQHIHDQTYSQIMNDLLNDIETKFDIDVSRGRCIKFNRS